MLIYLDHAIKEILTARDADGKPFTRADRNAAIMLGTVERVRPKTMTFVAVMADLMPILWSTGTGSEVMQRIAVPMMRGMISSTILPARILKRQGQMISIARKQQNDESPHSSAPR